jgi:large subunit ribosomal protein L13e
LKKPDLSKTQANTLPPLPLPTLAPAFSERKIDEAERKDSQYERLRRARSDARLVGKREKRAKQKADEEAAKGKK